MEMHYTHQLFGIDFKTVEIYNKKAFVSEQWKPLKRH